MSVDSHETSLVVIAKTPVPGRVKTRLMPTYTADEASRLAEAALADTLRVVAATPASERILALEGEPGAWLPPGISVIPQRGAGLDERLAAAFDDAVRIHPAPVLLIGMDTPQVTADLLSAASTALLTPGVDAVIGPATDGGWWALGLRRVDRSLLLGVAMSTTHTGADQLRRLRDAGLLVALLPTLTDVDEPRSAAQVAEAAPDTRFATAFREMVAQ